MSDFVEADGVRNDAGAGERLGWVDLALVIIFLLGLYSHFTIQLSAKVPIPSAPAGVAGLVLLWRRRGAVTPPVFVAFTGVVLLYLVSILCAVNLAFLSRRLNGLIQLVYSLTIGAGLYLTLVRATRRQAAALFLGFALTLLIGCLLEDFGGFRPISDAVRERLYSAGIYENDLRDTLLYGKVRPKFFASEPASVTFTFALCAFLWLVLSRMRGKLLVYCALIAASAVAMPGPTLLLMVLLVLPYQIFLAGQGAGSGWGAMRLLKVVSLVGVGTLVFIILANTLFAPRLREIAAGNDPSFFYRVQGPALAALDIIKNYPIAGAGLTGEPFVEAEVVNVYVKSSAFSSAWRIVTPSTELLINYFWLHWIYLGAVWGVIMLVAVSWWLGMLGVRTVAFAWFVWAILGQASGAYVGPTAWAVLYLAGAASVLHRRRDVAASVPKPHWQPRLRLADGRTADPATYIP